MTWVRIDDRFAQHPKVVAAGPLAMAMQVAGLCYCNRELTDGFIPRSIARTLLDWEIERQDGRLYTVAITCGMAGDDMSCGWVIDLLVETGMWEEVPGGYRIHDYLDYQPSRETVLHEREMTAKRQSDFRQRKQQSKRNAVSNAVTNSVTNGTSNASVTGAPTPVPVPTPPMGDKSPKPPTARKTTNRINYSEDFESFWQAYPSGHGSKKAAYTEWQRLNLDSVMAQEVIDAVHGWMQSDRWKRGYIKDAERWLKGEMWMNVPPPQEITLTVHRGGNANGRASLADREAEFDRWRRERNGMDPVEEGDVIEVKGAVR